jgi:hypothetical protein
MKFVSAYSDGEGLYVFVTRSEGGIKYGVLVNVPTGRVGEEEPADSIVNRLPYSEFEPVETGDVDPKARGMIDATPEPVPRDL